LSRAKTGSVAAATKRQQTLKQLALIAAHGWDIQGAAHAGLMTGYVSRGKPFPSVMPPPLVSGEDLQAVARQLIRK
jgi:2-haloacid dehalogenase